MNAANKPEPGNDRSWNDDCQPVEDLDIFDIVATLTEQGHDVEQMNPEDWADIR